MLKKALYLLPLLLLLAAVPLMNAWKINVFSLDFLWSTLAAPSLRKGAPSQAPRAHQRAQIWLAQSELAAHPQNAGSIVDSLSGSNDPLSLSMYAKLVYARGDLETAIRAWEQIRDVQSLLTVGDELVEQGNFEAAQKAYTAAQAIQPERASDRLVSLLLWNKNSPAEAEVLARRLLTLYPASGCRLTWLRSLADSLRLQRKFDEAIAVYRQVIAENPQDWAAYTGLGWSFYERGDGFQAAMETFDQAVSLNPSTGEADFAVAELLVREKRYAEADAWYARAIGRSPENKWMYLARANALSTSGELAEADQVYQETAERFPAFVQNYCSMAWNDRLMERRREAVATIEKASALGGEQGTPAWCHLSAGWIYEWAGEIDRAIQSYEKVLAADPANSQALEGMSRLKK